MINLIKLEFVKITKMEKKCDLLLADGFNHCLKLIGIIFVLDLKKITRTKV